MFNRLLLYDLLLKLLAFFPMFPILKAEAKYSPVKALLGRAMDLLSSSSMVVSD
jgi:hypothetical protein